MPENSYDLVPYESVAYRPLHIAHLFAIGRLANLTPPDFRRSRVLELGCASGGNLIPMADQYGESEFLGIDASAAQIRQGQELIDELALSNISLRNQSILDLEGSIGEFDYIICHGVFSWVSSGIQARILDILQQHLSATGLAVVSYNTLPGWNAVRGLRDIMLYHTQFFAASEEKIVQARALLKFLIDAQEDRKSFYSALLEKELELLNAVPDHYVFHEYLEEFNQPFYLHEFAAAAGKRGLSYVGDTDVPSMYLGNYAASVGKLLAASSDPVRMEQYLDFVNNRRFRSSVLTRHGAGIDRAIPADRMEEFWLLSEMQPDHPAPEGELAPAVEMTFTGRQGRSLTTRDDAGTAFLLTLARQGVRPMTVREVVAEAKERHRLPQAEPELRPMLCEAALRLFLRRMLHLLSDPGRHVATISNRPIALPVARCQAARGERVTNGFHEMVQLDAPSRFVLQLLDGTRDRAALIEVILAAIESGEMKFGGDEQPVADLAAMTQRIGMIVDDVLKRFAAHALLTG